MKIRSSFSPASISWRVRPGQNRTEPLWENTETPGRPNTVLFCLWVPLPNDAGLSKADGEWATSHSVRGRAVKFITLVKQRRVHTISRRILTCSSAINKSFVRSITATESSCMIYRPLHSRSTSDALYLQWEMEAALQPNWINVFTIVLTPFIYAEFMHF